jgi:hypothetical protein
MIYRKSSPQPSRLLLRIVAAASTGAALACGGSTSSEENHMILNGSLPAMPQDGGDAMVSVGGGTMIAGSIDAGILCNPCGVVAVPSDGGDAMVFVGGGTMITGVAPAPPPDGGVPADGGDDGGDASLHCGNGGVCGVVAHPGDGG